MAETLDHIGIAVPSLERALPIWVEAIGMKHEKTESVLSERVRVAILSSGDSRVELLEPASDDSPISQFLKKRGGGVHHLAFSVSSIETEVQRLRTAGAKLIEPAPRPGAEGTKVAFLHPSWTGGILIELVQRPKASA